MYSRLLSIKIIPIHEQEKCNIEHSHQNDPYATLLGITIKEACFEKAVAEMDVQPQFCNVLGTVHGAVIFALADSSFAAACNSGTYKHIGLQTEIRYIGQARSNKLIAQAELVKASKKFAHYQVLVQDDLENEIALFIGTAYNLGQ